MPSEERKGKRRGPYSGPKWLSDGETLKRIRGARDWTQVEVLERLIEYGCDVDERTYRDWENGKTPIHPTNVEALRQIFGGPAEQLGLQLVEVKRRKVLERENVSTPDPLGQVPKV